MKVTNMFEMFNECNFIEYLDLSNFDTINVTNMGFMFKNCHELKEIKGINNFNTKNVLTMILMFKGCIELKHLDLSNFNTEKVTNIMKCLKNVLN